MRTAKPITRRCIVRPNPPRPSLATAAAAAVAAIERLEDRRLLSTVPNDPSYAEQWGLADANAPAAWDAGTGSATVLVGHIDTGVDYTHVDLYKNVWINQAEIPRAVKRKLVDVDGDKRISFWDLNDTANAGRVADVNANGFIDAGDLLNPYKADGSGGWEDGKNGRNNKRDTYVDDLVGWDFAGNDNDPMDADAGSHGTHTAGTIAAEGNNGIGVAGIVWKASLMALKVFADGGDGAGDAAVAAAIRYAADYGARVTNNSYGGAGGGRAGGAIYDALVYADAKGVISVFAAGNDGVDNDNSPLASYPASYTLDTIVSVAASDSTGRVTYWSNYGATSVDLAAPGDGILSTVRGDAYATESGTSMAAPFVTGTIALMLSQNPDLTASEVKSRLLTGADEQAAQATRAIQVPQAVAAGGWGFANRRAGDTATDATLNVANAVQGVAGEQVADDATDGGTAGDGTTTTEPTEPVYPFPWFGFAWGDGTGMALGRAAIDYGSAQSWSVVAAADGYGWRFVG